MFSGLWALGSSIMVVTLCRAFSMEQNSVKYFIYTILLNHLDMPMRELLLFPFYRLHKIIFRNCNTSIEAQAYKPRCYRALRCLIIASWRFMFSWFWGLLYVTYIKRFSTKELKFLEQLEVLKESFLSVEVKRIWWSQIDEEFQTAFLSWD